MTVSTAVERKIATILFADLVGFTSLAERLDAEDVAAVQTTYFDAVRDTVERHGGRVEKYIGDAAMAVFGFPATRDDDAERAVRAGLSLVSSIGRLAVRLGLEEEELGLRVGVNSGEVLESSEHDATQMLVTGDPVNVAARLQAAAEPNAVLVGEITALAVADSIELVDAGLLELKGRRNPVHAWAAVKVREHPSRDHAMGRLRSPIVGRSTQLASLHEALTRCTTSSSAERWLIVSLPGVGKTRLVDEFALAARDVQVLRGRVRRQTAGPDEVVGELVACVCADRPRVAEELQERLVRSGISPERARVVVGATLPLAGGAGGTRATVHDRDALHHAWLTALDACSGDRAGLWIVEDVHWAPDDLLAFLDLAGRAPTAAGRLVLTTSRPSLLERSPEWCDARGKDCLEILHLPPLSPPAATTLVRALVGDAVPSDLANSIVDRSDGNPLFIEELLRSWISAGILVYRNERWVLDATPNAIALPKTVQAIYDAQIDDLPAVARHVLRSASVAGRRFSLDSVEALGVPAPRRGLEVLRRRALVLGPEQDRRWGDTYTYRHALLHEVAYESLLRAERVRLHLRLARWIARRAGDDELAEPVAHQYEQALAAMPGLVVRGTAAPDPAEIARLAAHWFERAAERAWISLAHDTARELFRRAFELSDESATDDRARRLARLGEATASTANMDDGAHALEQALQLWRERFLSREVSADERRHARRGVARTAASLGRVRIQQIGFGEANALAAATLADIGEAVDEETARLLILEGNSGYALTSDRIDTRRRIDRAVAIARELGDPGLELDAFEGFLAIRASDRILLSVADLQRIDELARSEQRWSTVVMALQNRALLPVPDEAWKAWPLLAEADEIAEAHALTECLAWSNVVRAEAGLVAGEWDRGLDAALQAIDVGERFAYSRAVIRAWFVAVALAYRRGDRAVLERGLNWWRPRGFIPPNPPGRVWISALDAYFTRAGIQGRSLPAVDLVVPGFALAAMHSYPTLLMGTYAIVESWLEAGLVGAVRSGLSAMAESNAAPDSTRLSRAVELLERARLLEAEGAMEAANTASRAVEGFRMCRAPWWIAEGIHLLERSGASSSALSREAAEIDERLGVARGYGSATVQ